MFLSGEFVGSVLLLFILFIHLPMLQDLSYFTYLRIENAGTITLFIYVCADVTELH